MTEWVWTGAERESSGPDIWGGDAESRLPSTSSGYLAFLPHYRRQVAAEPTDTLRNGPFLSCQTASELRSVPIPLAIEYFPFLSSASILEYLLFFRLLSTSSRQQNLYLVHVRLDCGQLRTGDLLLLLSPLSGAHATPDQRNESVNECFPTRRRRCSPCSRRQRSRSCAALRSSSTAQV